MKPYDVGISYSRKDSGIVNRLSNALSKLGIRYFLDTENRPQLAGKRLPSALRDIYRDQLLRYLPVFSCNFLNSEYAMLELQAALEQIEKNEDYFLPIRLDSTVIPSMPSEIDCLDINEGSIDAVAQTIVERLLIDRCGQLPVNDIQDVETPHSLHPPLQAESCPLGQAHMLHLCHSVNKQLTDSMTKEWINDLEYEQFAQFPDELAGMLIEQHGVTWPSYQMQLTFLDWDLKVLKHECLKTGAPFMECNLPQVVKEHIASLIDRDNEEAYHSKPFFWQDTLNSHKCNSASTLPRKNIGQLVCLMGGSGSGPFITEFIVFGEIHLH